jgi:hypothetical protein
MILPALERFMFAEHRSPRANFIKAMWGLVIGQLELGIQVVEMNEKNSTGWMVQVDEQLH